MKPKDNNNMTTINKTNPHNNKVTTILTSSSKNNKSLY